MDTYHWDVLATFHWDVVGCFIWDVPATSQGRTERRRFDVAMSCCRVRLRFIDIISGNENCERASNQIQYHTHYINIYQDQHFYLTSLFQISNYIVRKLCLNLQNMHLVCKKYTDLLLWKKTELLLFIKQCPRSFTYGNK